MPDRVAEQAPARELPAHVTTPLLQLMAQRALDADYAHVAARRASGEAPTGSARPRRTAAVVLAVFGVLVATAAVQTSRNSAVSEAGRETLITQIQERRTVLSSLQAQVASLQQDTLALQKSASSEAAAADAASSRLQRLQVRTGYAAVHGPGLRVVVDDAPGSDLSAKVRDSDLALLTDGLWGAGAEAISVNGLRVTVLSSFRNVGRTILLNSQPLNPPYTLSVIGDRDTLQADFLATSAGSQWYALSQSLGFGFTTTPADDLSLPAATPRPLRSARQLVLDPDQQEQSTKGADS